MNKLIIILGIGFLILIQFGCQRRIRKTSVEKDYTSSYNQNIEYFKSSFTLAYQTTGRNGKVKGNIALINDSLFFINVISPLGNEIARLFMENNELLFINRLNRTYIDTTMQYFHHYIHDVDLSSVLELVFAGILNQNEWDIHDTAGKNDCPQLFLVGKGNNKDIVIHFNNCFAEQKRLKIVHEDLLSNVQLVKNSENGFYLPEKIEIELYELDSKLIFEMEEQEVNEKFQIKKSIPNRYEKTKNLF